jgi:hypothetical protein
VIDRGGVRKRKKRASKKFSEAFGHTPLSLEEGIWKYSRPVVGTGTGAQPSDEGSTGRSQASQDWMILPTAEAIQKLEQQPDGTNAILHLTC